MNTKHSLKPLNVVRLVFAFLLAFGVAFSLVIVPHTSEVGAAVYYGAEANNTGDPIGGGTGYSNIITTGNYIINNQPTAKAEFLAALGVATTGQVIYITDNISINLSGTTDGDEYNIEVATGVTIASDRGNAGSLGALLYTNTTTYNAVAGTEYVYFFLITGDDVTFNGLRIRGPYGETDSGGIASRIRGIGWNSGEYHGLEVENCKIYNWPTAGVQIRADGLTSLESAGVAYIHHNYIHNCRLNGLGYGVEVTHGSVIIEANRFDLGRHFISGSRVNDANWEARFNEFGQTTHTSLDQHGGNDDACMGFSSGPDAAYSAGNYISIHHNTFESTTQPAVGIRGVPATQCVVYRNWSRDNEADAVWSGCATYTGMGVYVQQVDRLGLIPYQKMSVWDNWYGIDPPPDSGPPTPDEEYENFTTDDSSSDNIQSDNWTMQTFTTITASHSVDGIYLKLYRVGNPGTVTVSIRETDNISPIGADLYSGTYDGNLLTDNTSGAWYYFDMEPGAHPLNGLEVSTEYAIVVRAVAGNVFNCVFWRENAAGGYADGAPGLSGNGGTTWVADTGDRVFEIYGSSLLDILNVGIFSDYQEDGDWLIALHYFAEPPPAYPGGTPSQYVNICLSDGVGNYYGKVGLMAWGSKPGSIYLSSATVISLGLHWKTAYQVSLKPIAGRWTTLPDDATYDLTTSNWLGNDKNILMNWVRGVAQDIEEDYSYLGLDIYTERVGTTTFDPGQGVLTQTGGQMFLVGMPYLNQRCPELFIVNSQEFGIPEGTYICAGENSWIEKLGTTLSADFTTFGAAFNLSGKTFAAVLLFVLIIGAAGLFSRATGDARVGVVGAMVILPVGWYFAILPIALLAIIIQFLILFLVWRMFWSTT